jgi:hypothetical protein
MCVYTNVPLTNLVISNSVILYFVLVTQIVTRTNTAVARFCQICVFKLYFLFYSFHYITFYIFLEHGVVCHVDSTWYATSYKPLS